MLKSDRWTSELGSRSDRVDFLSQIDSSGLYFEKEGDLKKIWDSQTHGFGGPQKLAVFVFFYSVWLAIASTGRATPETHHQARLAQTDSNAILVHYGLWLWAPRFVFA
jgi:hypothetical protein